MTSLINVINKFNPPPEPTYKHSKAEKRFRDFIYDFHSDFSITKKGLPDFMILKEMKVVGFVEVKDGVYDYLSWEQELFKDFCRKNKIPYQVWQPYMRKWATKGNFLKMKPETYKRFKNDVTYGGEIEWNKL